VPASGSLHEGWPYPAMQARVILSGEFDAEGKPVNMMCEGGVGEDFRGEAAVPCSEAPQLLLGPGIPQWEATFNTRITLFRNLTLHGLVEWRGEHWRSSD